MHGLVELAGKAIRVHNCTREHQSDTWFCTQPAVQNNVALSAVRGVVSVKFEGFPQKGSVDDWVRALAAISHKGPETGELCTALDEN